MKKSILVYLFGANIIFAAPSSEIPLSNVEMSKPSASLEEEEVFEKGFYYVRFATAESSFNDAGNTFVPGLGLGYRRRTGSGAADISISGIGRSARKNEWYSWTFPKVSYIQYLNPVATDSFYFGGGLAWGGIDSKKQGRRQEFIGIIPSAILGYEFARKSTVLGFTELNISQPASAIYQRGPFLGPVIEVNFGMGF